MMALLAVALWITLLLVLVEIRDGSERSATIIGLWMLLGWLFSAAIIVAIQFVIRFLIKILL